MLVATNRVPRQFLKFTNFSARKNHRAVYYSVVLCISTTFLIPRLTATESSEQASTRPSIAACVTAGIASSVATGIAGALTSSHRHTSAHSTISRARHTLGLATAATVTIVDPTVSCHGHTSAHSTVSRVTTSLVAAGITSRVAASVTAGIATTASPVGRFRFRAWNHQNHCQGSYAQNKSSHSFSPNLRV